MFLKSRKSLLSLVDNRVLVYSTLFLVCALISALTPGNIGLAVFLPCAFMIEYVIRTRCDADEDEVQQLEN